MPTVLACQVCGSYAVRDIHKEPRLQSFITLKTPFCTPGMVRTAGYSAVANPDDAIISMGTTPASSTGCACNAARYRFANDDVANLDAAKPKRPITV